MIYLRYKYVVKWTCFKFIHLRRFTAKITAEKKYWKNKIYKNVDLQITKKQLLIIYNRDVILYKAAEFQFP